MSIAAFRSALTNFASGKGLRMELYEGTPRRSSNIFVINTQPTFSVLYVKISNSNPGFWGLTKNQLDCLELNKTRWFAVLLARAINNGYVFTSNVVIGKIISGTFELSKDGDYKVNENTDCGLNNSFNGFVQLFNLIK